MATQRSPFNTLEEYLDLDAAAEYKSEYLSGQIYAMAGGSPEHNRIGFNVITALGAQLSGAPCIGYTSDQRIKAGGLYTYPDVTVICGQPRFSEGRKDTLLNPNLIVEVLSPSTEAYDRGEKFAHYRQIESLQEYVLISQDKPRIERYLRQPDNTWNYTAADGLQAALSLNSIGCTLKLEQVYTDVELQPYLQTGRDDE